MNPRLAPILAKECKALKWNPKGKFSARIALLDLLAQIENLAEKLKENKLPTKKHLGTKELLKTATKEIGAGLTACLLIKDSLEEKWAVEKEAALKEKSDIQLLRELLKLAQNEPKVRAKSHQFEEAWVEIETRYFAKMSLYRTELARRG